MYNSATTGAAQGEQNALYPNQGPPVGMAEPAANYDPYPSQGYTAGMNTPGTTYPPYPTKVPPADMNVPGASSPPYPTTGPPAGINLAGTSTSNPQYPNQVHPAGMVPDHVAPLSANASSETPSAPPMEKMDSIAGYSGNNFDNDYMAPPPTYDEAMAAPARDATQIRNVPVVTEADARKALLEEVGRHCCWGKGPAEKLNFVSLTTSSAFHYTLDTFTESRSTKWAFEPYMGQPISGIGMGPAPMPWDVVVPAPTLYANHVHKQEVPNTASVKPCHGCMGTGRTRCHHCSGRGFDHCTHCNHHHHGHGHHHGHRNHGHHTCSFCHGTRRRRCTWCHETGFKQCSSCQGRGSLKCFIRLTVTWTNHMEDRLADLNNLPVELMRDVSGEIAVQEENQRVWPISHFPDAKINSASHELVTKHHRAYPNERILMQRHKVRIIPVTEAKYSYEGNDGLFYVYGFEQKAHAPDYPSTCCGCCCTIM